MMMKDNEGILMLRIDGKERKEAEEMFA